MHWPAPCMNSLRTCVHEWCQRSTTRNPVKIHFHHLHFSKTHKEVRRQKLTMARRSGANPGKPPASMSALLPRNTKLMSTTSHRHRNAESWLQRPLPLLAVAARKPPLDKKQRRSPTEYIWKKRRKATPQAPNRTTARNSGSPNDPGAETKCGDKP